MGNDRDFFLNIEEQLLQASSIMVSSFQKGLDVIHYPCHGHLPWLTFACILLTPLVILSIPATCFLFIASSCFSIFDWHVLH